MQMNTDILASVYKSVFSTEEGKIILDDLKMYGMVDEITIYNKDVNDLLFNEGKRAIVQYINKMINFDIK